MLYILVPSHSLRDTCHPSITSLPFPSLLVFSVHRLHSHKAAHTPAELTEDLILPHRTNHSCYQHIAAVVPKLAVQVLLCIELWGSGTTIAFLHIHSYVHPTITRTSPLNIRAFSIYAHPLYFTVSHTPSSPHVYTPSHESWHPTVTLFSDIRYTSTMHITPAQLPLRLNRVISIKAGCAVSVRFRLVHVLLHRRQQPLHGQVAQTVCPCKGKSCCMSQSHAWAGVT